MSTEFPMQPLHRDKHGTIRFKANPIVEHLLDISPQDLNKLIRISKFTQADWEHFYQLIGYSLAGYAELSFVSDEAFNRAEAAARESGLL